MESCLKKLVLDAPETGFQDAERAERKPLVPPGRELVPGGIHWRQMGVDSLPSGVQKVYSSYNEGRRSVFDNEGRQIAGVFGGQKDRSLQLKLTYSFDF